jgi:membrane-associated protein
MMENVLDVILSQDFQNYFSKYGYIGIYIWFVTVDQIAPLPEEISLIAIGYLSSIDILNPVLAGAFSLLAFLTIDIIYYYLTRSGNKYIKRFAKNANSPKMTSYKRRLKKNLPGTLLLLSFLPRIRLLSPVFVALAGLEFRRFILYNSMCLALFIAVYISLGVLFKKHISSFLAKVGTFEPIVFVIALAVLIVVSILIFWKLKKKKK